MLPKNYRFLGCQLYVTFKKFRLQTKSAGRKMIYVKMPAMIFILASGYLFAVYLLLALAKRNSNKMPPTSTYEATQKPNKLEAAVNPNVTDVVNTQELMADG
jgi:hypothetical protein